MKSMLRFLKPDLRQPIVQGKCPNCQMPITRAELVAGGSFAECCACGLVSDIRPQTAPYSMPAVVKILDNSPDRLLLCWKTRPISAVLRMSMGGLLLVGSSLLATAMPASPIAQVGGPLGWIGTGLGASMLLFGGYSLLSRLETEITPEAITQRFYPAFLARSISIPAETVHQLYCRRQARAYYLCVETKDHDTILLLPAQKDPQAILYLVQQIGTFFYLNTTGDSNE